jgi:hypothetical protein
MFLSLNIVVKLDFTPAVWYLLVNYIRFKGENACGLSAWKLPDLNLLPNARY